MILQIPAQARDAIEKHAMNCQPEECCGLVAMDADSQIRFVYPLTNIDRSGSSFTIDPDESYGAFMHAESMGWSIGGVFHSHPTGPLGLSAKDLEQALDGWIYVLASPDGLAAWSMAGGSAIELALVSPVRVVAAILIQNRRILLCHRSPHRKNYPNVWDLPGGHIEDGETASAALTRELSEELAITPTHGIGKSWRTLVEGDLELTLFVVTNWEGTPVNAAADEHDDIGWFDSDQLSDLALAHRDYRDVLEQALTIMS